MIMQTLELKIPPPIVALLIGSAMWVVAPALPLMEIPTLLRLAVASVLVLVGVGFNVAGMVSFRRARTTLNPLHPDKATVLVTTGIYRITRNPMYVGGLILLCAWAAYLSSAWALFGPVLFVLYVRRFQILPEERILSTLFGRTFTEYQTNVRRWL